MKNSKKVTGPGTGRSSVLVMVGGSILLTLAGKLGALFRDVVLATGFGAGTATDAYFVANIVPGLAWAAFYATIVAVFLPIYLSERENSALHGQRIAIEAVRIYTFSGLVVMLATWVLAEPIVAITAPDAAPEVRILAVRLIFIMTLSFAVTGYVGVQNALQQANGAYLWPLTVPVINNGLTIFAILIAARFDNIAIAVGGATLGWLVQAPLQRWQTRRFYPRAFGFGVRLKTLRRISLLSWPVMVGIVLDQANIYIGVAIASRFGEGAVSYISYSSRLTLFIGNLVSWLVAYFLFPRIAASAARKCDKDAGKTLGLGVTLIVGLTVPLLGVAVVYGTDIIRLVYGRGAFVEASVVATAAVFVPHVFGTVFMGVREILNRAFFSYQRTSVPMAIGALAAGINLLAGVALSARFGLPGIAMGTTISATVFVVLQVTVIARWKPELIDRAAMRHVVALFAAGIAGTVAGVVVARIAAEWFFLARLLSGSAIVGLTYIGTVWLADRLFSLGIVASMLRVKDSNRSDHAAVPLDPETI
ncbi:hypothetical protein GRI89_13525 [Altererythrobacter salegens]|uniref:Lipid II flippase MurJ n=1 Tax=Croceibacterium salegens TaxID=1737568 RepID=A0A6I4SZB2_9SPHN|nr:oligosaccharide flippase family protein [Croceibacterium salegens]MXO60560.1 hypothetical protein [Croceibacterium salegens]